MEKVRLIDLDHLNVYVADDDALRDEILTIFEEQVQKWEQFFDPEQSDEEWYDACHALKGAARGIGAWQVGDLCEQAEKLVGRSETELVQRSAILTEIIDLLDRTVTEARQIRDFGN